MSPAWSSTARSASSTAVALNTPDTSPRTPVGITMERFPAAAIWRRASSTSVSSNSPVNRFPLGLSNPASVGRRSTGPVAGATTTVSRRRDASSGVPLRAARRASSTGTSRSFSTSWMFPVLPVLRTRFQPAASAIFSSASSSETVSVTVTRFPEGSAGQSPTSRSSSRGSAGGGRAGAGAGDRGVALGAGAPRRAGGGASTPGRAGGGGGSVAVRKTRAVRRSASMGSPVRRRRPAPRARA